MRRKMGTTLLLAWHMADDQLDESYGSPASEESVKTCKGNQTKRSWDAERQARNIGTTPRLSLAFTQVRVASAT